MIGGISGTSGYQSLTALQSAKQRPDPKEFFNKVDSNADGGVDQTELSGLLEKMAEKSGTTIDAEEALTTFDANSDGVLDQQELKSLMEESGFRPPPPPVGQAMGAYEMFSAVDSSGDSSIDETELTTLLDKIADLTSSSLDGEETLANYDADASGSLDEDEWPGLMQDLASPPPMEQATAAYGMNMEDPMQSLLDTLTGSDSGNQQNIFSRLNVIS
ncbi:hypothetical protein [Trichloromonas sp.]|uniref:hypothetical protein n=1 Tax=Trichloromonas sp. TaxID=3069249 RepID=UPI002A449CAF|nr:hypothetical protein [Trichloromonas sp.]